MSTPQNELKYFNAFNLFPEIGAVRLKKLLNYFPDMETAWQAGALELRQAGLDEKIAQKIIAGKDKINLDKEFEKLAKEGITIITILDNQYPKLLKEIYDPPTILYTKGSFKPEDDLAIAVVGTRKPTMYGARVAEEFSHKLSTVGLTIISGLALGIDTLAHKAALKADGRTIAVLGSGLDLQSIYPTSNLLLSDTISDRGVLISEYPIGTKAMPYHFPARNRIISGLSIGTLIVEATEKSGTFLTANHALDQGRQIFAIPGPIYSPQSAGPNKLIKMGAKLVANTNDILEDLNLKLATQQQEARQIIPDSEEEKLILETLAAESIHIDKIIAATKLDTAVVGSTLSLMEIKGKVKNLGGMTYVIAR